VITSLHAPVSPLAFCQRSRNVLLRLSEHWVGDRPRRVRGLSWGGVILFYCSSPRANPAVDGGPILLRDPWVGRPLRSARGAESAGRGPGCSGPGAGRAGRGPGCSGPGTEGAGRGPGCSEPGAEGAGRGPGCSEPGAEGAGRGPGCSEPGAEGAGRGPGCSGPGAALSEVSTAFAGARTGRPAVSARSFRFP
jgi:hypothetical protein